MREYLKFFIDGEWVDPVTPKTLDVINPATEGVAGRISAGSAADVDKAVKAARKAFETYSLTTREERIELLERIQAEYQKRLGDIAGAFTEEMGAARQPGAAGPGRRSAWPISPPVSPCLRTSSSRKPSRDRPTSLGAKEPIGVVGL